MEFEWFWTSEKGYVAKEGQCRNRKMNPKAYLRNVVKSKSRMVQRGFDKMNNVESFGDICSYLVNYDYKDRFRRYRRN